MRYGGHVYNFCFAAWSKFCCVASNWQGFLFVVSSLENTCVYGFNVKYLRSYGCKDTHFTALVNCANPKTKMHSKTLKCNSNLS